MFLWEIYENQYFRGFSPEKYLLYLAPPQKSVEVPSNLSEHQLIMWVWII